LAGTGVPAAIAAANYNANNQQLALGTTSATYDNNGNLATLTDTGLGNPFTIRKLNGDTRVVFLSLGLFLLFLSA
jgi:hypothetical protein